MKSQVFTPSFKKKIPSSILTSRNPIDQPSSDDPRSSAIKRLFQLRLNSQKREDHGLTFPSTVPRHPKRSHSISFASEKSTAANSYPHLNPVQLTMTTSAHQAKAKNTEMRVSIRCPEEYNITGTGSVDARVDTGISNSKKQYVSDLIGLGYATKSEKSVTNSIDSITDHSANSLKDDEMMNGSMPKLSAFSSSSSDSDGGKRAVNFTTDSKLSTFSKVLRHPSNASSALIASCSNIEKPESTSKAEIIKSTVNESVNFPISQSGTEKEREIKTYDYTSFPSVNGDFNSTNKLEQDEANDSNRNMTTENVQQSDTSNSDDKVEDKQKCEIKYSWQDLASWVSPSQKQRMLEAEAENAKKATKKTDMKEQKKLDAEKEDENKLKCQIKYSWQIIGMSTQTENEYSDMIYRREFNKKLLTRKPSDEKRSLRIKYSWEIVGLSTQTSEISCNKDNSKTPGEVYSWQNLTRPRITNNENTDELCKEHRQIATENDSNECKIHYSWEDLIRQRITKEDDDLSAEIISSDGHKKNLSENIVKKKTPIESARNEYNVKDHVTNKHDYRKKKKKPDKTKEKPSKEKNKPEKNTPREQTRNHSNFQENDTKNCALPKKRAKLKSEASNVRDQNTVTDVSSKILSMVTNIRNELERRIMSPDMTKNKEEEEKENSKTFSREENKGSSNLKEGPSIERTAFNENISVNPITNYSIFGENFPNYNTILGKHPKGSCETLQHCQSYNSVSSSLLSVIQEVIADIDSGFAAAGNVQSHPETKKESENETGSRHQEEGQLTALGKPKTHRKRNEIQTAAEKERKLKTETKPDAKQSSRPVSGIRQVIAKLDELVNAQKNMQREYLKLHGLEEDDEVSEPIKEPIVQTVNPEKTNLSNRTDGKIEKVEIFPSTLKVLGNYIVKDILPNDLHDLKTDGKTERSETFPSALQVLGNYIAKDIIPTNLRDLTNLLDKNWTDFELHTKQTEGRQSKENVDPAETVHGFFRDGVNEGRGRGLTNIAPHISDVNLSSNSCLPRPNLGLSSQPIPTLKEPDKLSPIVNNLGPNLDRNAILKSESLLRKTNFSCMLSYPVTFNTTYDETIFHVNDRFPTVTPKADGGQCPESSSVEDRSSVYLPLLGYDYEVTHHCWDDLMADMDQAIVIQTDSSTQSVVRENANATGSFLSHTNNTEPLKPKRCGDADESAESGDSITRRNELLTRLDGAVTKLKQCEQSVDADWKLDYTVLDAEKEVCIEGIKLPKQAEENIRGIVQSAEEYIVKLEEQIEDLNIADQQIVKCTEKTFKDIDEAYQALMDKVCREINQRRDLVRLETEVYKNEGLVPLKACRQEVNAQIRSTRHLIVLTETMLKNPYTFNKERLTKIIAASGNMGRIPAVPMLEELPYVTFRSPSEELKGELSERISRLGCVLRMGPAQLTEVLERPGSLQVRWYIVDPEFAAEEQTFVVQKANGEVLDPTSPDFETVYEGPETSCFIRDLPIDVPITLRVGIQVSDTAWSVHRIAKTTIPAYTWDTDNKNYLITNSGKIATKVTHEISTLRSRGPQFDANHIIEFKFLEAIQGTDDEGIGLVFQPTGIDDSMKRNGALLITPQGKIFIDGEEKLMQLPKVRLGTRIVFTTEKKDEDTIRITIECSDKAVTYDWTVGTPLHFGARFTEYNKWNIMVK